MQDCKEEFHSALESVESRNPQVTQFLDRAVDDLNPARVLRIFSKVLDDDLVMLDLACRPEHLLVTYLAVPPVCIRPSVEMDTGGGSNEDDATTRLLAICDMSISIRKSLDMGIASVENIMEQWDFLQVGQFLPNIILIYTKYYASWGNTLDYSVVACKAVCMYIMLTCSLPFKQPHTPGPDPI